MKMIESKVIETQVKLMLLHIPAAGLVETLSRDTGDGLNLMLWLQTSSLSQMMWSC